MLFRSLFGYLPPTANPPSKTPLLTLLKQARAYGLGLVLSTQNPVDLDYKALSNAGTWFIGRLQTERDKQRVLEGLEGAAVGGKFDKARTEQILAGLGQRIFYLHSVHEDEPLIFSTRWAMSYLAGPLTKDQIASLPKKQVEVPIPVENKPQSRAVIGEVAPMIPTEIRQVYLPVRHASTEPVVYKASVIGIADVLYTSTKHNVSVSKN